MFGSQLRAARGAFYRLFHSFRVRYSFGVEAAAIELRSIEFIDSSGHLSLTWDPNDPADAERARLEFIQLRSAGYSFFKARVADAESQEAFGMEDGNAGDHGYLEVRRVEPSEVEPKHEPQRRGRPSKSAPKERVVAMRPMHGG